MTAFPYSIDHEKGIDDAQRMMRDKGVRHLPVDMDGEIVGLLSERDIDVARLLYAFDGAEDPPTVLALCNRDVFAIDIHSSLEATLRTMAKNRYGSAVVLREGRLAGIVTTVDVCIALATLLSSTVLEGDAA